MVGGTSIGASGGQSTNNDHDASSEFASETQTPVFSSEVGLDNITLNEEEQPTQRRQRARFTMEEDILLIQSWLNVSKDAVVGVNQKAYSFWQRIKENYNEYRGTLQARELSQLKCHWQKLNSTIQKFAGCYKQVVQRKKSGSSETNIFGNVLGVIITKIDFLIK
ncbi:glutathione S-transferase t2-like protein [Sesbania bispinosa]|nr:glutathione S-transferase t2-like protein [Sesbania bispinosa]